MKKKWIIWSLTISILLFFYVIMEPIMSNAEEPKYDVISSSRKIEIRQYMPMIVAEVDVTGERKDAINAGFRILADYIFGNNTAQKKIAMTRPVQQQKTKDTWKINFVMPSAYRIDDLPKPNNPKINIKEISQKKFVVITFSGMSSNELLQKNERKLVEYIKSKDLPVVGPVIYAFYNPPWTLPFMRRNEIMQQIDN